jgi:hypothetical protein
VVTEYIHIFWIHVFEDEKTTLVVRTTYRGWVLLEVGLQRRRTVNSGILHNGNAIVVLKLQAVASPWPSLVLRLVVFLDRFATSLRLVGELVQEYT